MGAFVEGERKMEGDWGVDKEGRKEGREVVDIFGLER